MQMRLAKKWVVPTGDDRRLIEAMVSACLEGSVETFEQLHDTSAPHLIPPASYLIRCAVLSKQLPMVSCILRLFPLRRLKAAQTKMDSLPYWDRIQYLDDAIFSAIAQGEVGIVKRLLKAGMPVVRYDQTGSACDIETLLYLAIADGQIEVAHLLLDHGANPNGSVSLMVFPSGDCMTFAARRGSDEMLELLLDYGGKIEGCNALWHMTKQCTSLEIAQRSLDLGPDINEVWATSFGNRTLGTALHAAATLDKKGKRVGSTDFAQWLLQKGIDHTIQDSSGRTAMQVAHDTGYKEMEDLIENWILSHSTQEAAIEPTSRRLRSSKRPPSPFRELEISKRGRTQKKST